MPPKPGPRFDPMPMLKIVAMRCRQSESYRDQRGFEGRPEFAHTNYRYMGDYIGVDARTISRWLYDGTISVGTADRCATALGMHPVEIWGDEWLEA